MPAWTEARLQELVQNGVQEGPTLEYKRCAALANTDESKNELSKDVSAFANSGGGTLVYGIVEQAHLPQGVDAGFDPTQTKREWIEHVMRSRIQPAIPDVTITPVALSGPAQGRVAYVIEVPQSVTAHQAFDRRYYKRHNFTSEPMLDYEIRDVMHRGDRPLVEPFFAFQPLSIEPHLHRYELIVGLENLGALPVQRIKLRFTFPIRLTDPPYAKYLFRDFAVAFGRFEVPMREFIAITTTGPLFPEERIDLSEWHFSTIGYQVDSRSADWIAESGVTLQWKIYADNMRPREGSIPISTLHNF